MKRRVGGERKKRRNHFKFASGFGSGAGRVGFVVSVEAGPGFGQVGGDARVQRRVASARASIDAASGVGRRRQRRRRRRRRRRPQRRHAPAHR